jgi:hypothetical protein
MTSQRLLLNNVRSFYDAGVVPTRRQTPLAKLLNRRGIRHTWLAEQLGVSKWVVHRVLTGKQAAPTGWYERAAKALDVPVDQIRPAEKAAA